MTLSGGKWRLPNKKELESLVDYSRIKPSINPVFKKVTSDFYFSSSSYAGDTTRAWLVYFESGYTSDGDKSYAMNVRCVR